MAILRIGANSLTCNNTYLQVAQGGRFYWKISEMQSAFNSSSYKAAGITTDTFSNGATSVSGSLDEVYATSTGTDTYIGATCYANLDIDVYTLYGYASVAVDGRYYVVGNSVTLEVVHPITLENPEITDYAATSANSIWLEFDALNSAASYVVQYRTSNSSPWSSRTVRNSVTAVTLTGLSAGTTYYIQYYGKDSTGDYQSSTSNIITVTTPEAVVVGEPTLTCTQREANSITLSFAATNATSYVIYKYTPGGTGNGWDSGTTIGSTEYTFDGLTAGTEYRFMCVGKNGASSGTYSDALYVTTRPVASTAITWSTTGITSVKVAYAALSGADAYLVLCKDSQSNVVQNISSSSPYTQIDLEPGSLYGFNYRGIKYLSENDFAYKSGSVTYIDGDIECESIWGYTKPDIGAITSTGVTPNSITVRMECVNGATTYQVRYKVNGDSSYTYIATPTLTYSDDYAFCTIDGLAEATDYIISYRAINDNVDGETYFGVAVGEWSNDAGVSTGQAAPVTPKWYDISKVSASTSSIVVKYSQLENAYQYVVTYYLANGGSADTPNSSTASTVLQRAISGLSPGRKYVFNYYGISSSGVEGSSIQDTEYIADRTFNTTMAGGGAITVTASTATTISLSLAAIDGASKYYVFYYTTSGSATGSPYIESSSTSVTLTGLDAKTTYYFCYFAESVDEIRGSFSGEYSTQTKELVPYWDWEIANGNVSDPDNAATIAETQRAEDAVNDFTLISNFSWKVWNDMCDKVNEVAKAAESSWLTSYDTFDNTKMTETDRTLTAKRFNSLNYNVQSRKATGIADQTAKSTSYPVRGSYFVTIMSKVNEWIESL